METCDVDNVVITSNYIQYSITCIAIYLKGIMPVDYFKWNIILKLRMWETQKSQIQFQNIPNNRITYIIIEVCLVHSCPT